MAHPPCREVPAGNGVRGPVRHMPGHAAHKAQQGGADVRHDAMSAGPADKRLARPVRRVFPNLLPSGPAESRGRAPRGSLCRGTCTACGGGPRAAARRGKMSRPGRIDVAIRGRIRQNGNRQVHCPPCSAPTAAKASGAFSRPCYAPLPWA